MDTSTKHPLQKPKPSLLLLVVGALGVVYGDIGTSTLYAINQMFFGHAGAPVTPEYVYGAIALAIWTLTFVVTLKDIVFVLRADNKGEGGIFALFGLLQKLTFRGSSMLTVFLCIAAGFLLADGLITPAISVLSAVEGLKIATVSFEPFIIPIVLGILTALFAIQYKGTGNVGRLFGPVILLWFMSTALLGLNQIFLHPAILSAFNPVYAFKFLYLIGPVKGLAVLGAAILVITGSEAIYADLGHFGKEPLQLSWLLIVYPALLLNYLGQGAYLLSGAPVHFGNIFYSLVPTWALYPMVILATTTTIIASQALISGTYSLIAQSIALGLTPRFRIRHTSSEQEGQIYIPTVNWFLYAGSIFMVLVFQSSTNLATAYGLTVAGVLLATSLAMIPLASFKWKWHSFDAWTVFGGFAVVELVFLIANSLKFSHGGYVPLIVAVAFYLPLANWQWGRRKIGTAFAEYGHRTVLWLVHLQKDLQAHGGKLMNVKSKADNSSVVTVQELVQLPRTVVVLVSRPIKSVNDKIPVVFRSYLKSSGALPQTLVFLSVVRSHMPRVNPHDRLRVFDFGSGIAAVHAYYGFMEYPDPYEIFHEVKYPGDFERCMVQVGEEEIMIAPNTPFFTRVAAKMFRFQLQIASRSHHHLGFRDDARLTKIVIPVTFDDHGTHVAIVDRDIHTSAEKAQQTAAQTSAAAEHTKPVQYPAGNTQPAT